MRHRFPLLVAAVTIALIAAIATTSTGPRPGVTHAAPAKRITVSLARQRLRAWEGNRVVLSTPVTTGNRYLPTPTGYFHVYAKYSPYTMVSPWPAGSPYWYPTSSMSFAMEFAQGYFIHDAPWRTVYGKASQGIGPPGTNYGGTHGCINVPYSAERFLFDWAPNGTLVHIVP